MTLKSDMTEALDDLLEDEEFGEQIIYKGVTIQAIVDIGVGSASTYRSGAVVDQGKIEVRVADVAAPKIYDPLVIRGGTWQVLRTLSSNFFSHVIEISSNERPKPKRP